MKNDPIIKKYLILCEGADAYYFLVSFLNSGVPTPDKHLSEDIQVINFGGINDLQNFLLVLRGMDGFEDVTNILIIRDAEKDYCAAVQSVISSLNNAGFDAPNSPMKWEKVNNIKIGYLLFPSCNNIEESGTLEDLCLNILVDDKLKEKMNDINVFLDNCSKNYGEKYPRKYKNKLYLYLNSSDKYVGLKVGEAAKVGAFNWNAKELQNLRNFIIEGYND